MNAAFAALALFAMLALAALGGAWLADRSAAARIAAAKADAKVCADQLQSKANALDQVRDQLADLNTRRARALADATAALDMRPAELDTRKADRDARQAAIGKLINEDSAVAALAGLPVPRALARQLWPDAAHSGAAAPH